MERFPITVPFGALPIPDSTPWTVEYFDDRLIVLGDPQWGTARQLPVEFFMREILDLDLSDPAAVAGTVTTFGLPTRPNSLDGVRALDQLPAEEWGATAALERALQIAARAYDTTTAAQRIADAIRAEFPGSDERLGIAVAVMGFRETLITDVGADPDGVCLARPMSLVTMDAVRLHLRVLRSLARQWIAHCKGEGAKALRAAWADEGFREPIGKDGGVHGSWRVWSNFLNDALRPAHARVVIPNIVGDPLSQNYGMPLYAIVALQLHNAVAEAMPVLTCQNEPCGRSFSRQRGGAHAGQYRSEGVMYCSTSCAKARAQREYRRRNRRDAAT